MCYNRFMKRVFITGASGGIGLSLGKIFAEKGYSVALGYFRHGERVEELARSLGEKGIFALPVGGDLSSYDQAKKAVEKVVSTFGGIDVLINNAGISQVGLFLDTTEESWRKIVDTNLSSAIYVTKFALEDMLKRGEGSIVNVSSVWGLEGGSLEVAYSTTKAGLVGFTKALAKEVSPIRVNCLAPDITDTPMNDHLTAEEKKEYAKDTKAGRVLSPDEVAFEVFRLAESGESGKILGI